ERGEGPQRRHGGAEPVAEVIADLRRDLAVSRDGREPRYALRQPVVGRATPGEGAPLAEARVGDVDEPRVHPAELAVADAELLLERARLEVLDHDVRARGELTDQLLARGRVHVDADVVLGVVRAEEGDRDALPEEGRV